MFNDPFINVQEIETELSNMQQMAEKLEMHFPLLSQKVAYIFTKIKECKTITEANDYFNILDKIQETLSCLVYKYNIGMPDRLDRFVRDFDNLEPIYREHYFKKITSNEYSF
ncbi:MAG TPA: hypothetical protein VHX42_03005 [Candidatus Babeliales bacterium]|jgi:hypothetical protein|nr:hypothetical protein [Candidatus Babeliales bacterium]